MEMLGQPQKKILKILILDLPPYDTEYEVVINSLADYELLIATTQEQFRDILSNYKDDHNSYSRIFWAVIIGPSVPRNKKDEVPQSTENLIARIRTEYQKLWIIYVSHDQGQKVLGDHHLGSSLCNRHWNGAITRDFLSLFPDKDDLW